MKKTLSHLADGRELIYFDSSDSSDRSAPDLRELAAATVGPEMRYDTLAGEWVGIAAQRQGRTFLPAADACPLCPSRAGLASEIPSSDYEVAVFENRFPSFSSLPAAVPDAIPASGRCEVVCFTPDHDSSFSQLSPERVRLVVDALADRTADLSAISGVEQVFCFENRGVEIGVTMHHPHGQIYAYPFVTPHTKQLLATISSDLRAYDDAIDHAGERIVAANDEWIAFVPYAARWPFEVYVFPRRRVPDLPALDDDARAAFGPFYTDILRRFDGLFGSPMPYISAWNQAPVREGRDASWLHLRLFSTRRAAGRLKYLAGSEAAMGAFVNDVRPEDAARALREVAA
jgi:UDPglucose--hexose-1-phosphate uridylyltransferase